MEPQESPLGQIELEAMRMWFEGYTSMEIEKSLHLRFGDAGVKADTVRRWFATGGKLHEIYKEYAESEARYRQEETRNAFRAHVKNAVRVLVQIMNDPAQHTPSRVRAAEDIINRELGEPLKVIAPPKDKGLVNEILREAGLLSDGNDNNTTEPGSTA